MKTSLPSWDPIGPNCDHPFVGPVGNPPNEPLETPLDQAYANDPLNCRRKLSFRDEAIICYLIKNSLVNRREAASLFEVSEKTISIIIYSAGLHFPRRKQLTKTISHAMQEAA